MVYIYFKYDEELLQIDQPSESLVEGDPLAEIKPNIQSYEFLLEENETVDDTGETNSRQAMDEAEGSNDEKLHDTMQIEYVRMAQSICFIRMLFANIAFHFIWILKEDCEFLVYTDEIDEEDNDKSLLDNQLEEELVVDKKRRFACKQCDKDFRKPGGLRQHMNTHTGERPFACDECDKSFSHSHTLYGHKRFVHGERLHACEHCDKRFHKATELKRHELTHTGTCLECVKCSHKQKQIVMKLINFDDKHLERIRL